jgi:hypothetical protein
MNTKLFKLITAGTLAVLLSSCGDTVVDNDDSNPVQKKATLNVRVRDASNGNPLEAMVTLNTTGESKATNTTGNFAFKNVPVGEHSVLIEKAGYASVIYRAPIGTITEQNIAIAQDYTVRADLYPKTASLSGVVTAEGIDGTISPIAGATVRIELAVSELVDQIITQATGVDGSFKFDSLPAVEGQYTVWVSDIERKYKFKQGPAVALKAGVASNLATSIKFTSNDLNSLFELVSYPSIIKSDTTLTIAFNNTIDFSRFNLNTSNNTVYLASPSDRYNPIGLGTNVTLTRVANADPTKLSLKLSGPSVPTTPRWPSTGFLVCFNDLKAIDGKATGYPYCTGTIFTSDNTVKFELKNYVSRVDSLDPVKLQFSLPIDAKEFQPGWITIPNIFAEKTVVNDTIILTPVGKWPGNFTVTISNLLLAANGTRLGTAASAQINIVTQDLSALQVGLPKQFGTPDYDLISPIKLRWKKVPGATDYRIYARASVGVKGTEFVYLKNASSQNILNNPDSTGVDITQADITAKNTELGLTFTTSDNVPAVLYPLQDNNTLEIFIQAYNSTSETSLAGAKAPANVLSVKDIKKPSVNASINYVPPAAGTTATGLNAVTVTSSPSIPFFDILTIQTNPYPNASTCVEFSEPMDTTTTTVPTGTPSPIVWTADAGLPVANIASKLAITTKWVKAAPTSITGTTEPGDKVLCLVLNTNSSNVFTSGSGSINMRVSISGLKDKAGNLISISPSSAPTVVTQALDIRFQATGIAIAPAP